jgi:hypothetical protein
MGCTRLISLWILTGTNVLSLLELLDEPRLLDRRLLEIEDARLLLEGWLELTRLDERSEDDNRLDDTRLEDGLLDDGLLEEILLEDKLDASGARLLLAIIDDTRDDEILSDELLVDALVGDELLEEPPDDAPPHAPKLMDSTSNQHNL